MQTSNEKQPVQIFIDCIKHLLIINAQYLATLYDSQHCLESQHPLFKQPANAQCGHVAITQQASSVKK